MELRLLHLEPVPRKATCCSMLMKERTARGEGTEREHAMGHAPGVCGWLFLERVAELSFFLSQV